MIDPLFFLVYIDILIHNIDSDVKLIVDDTSLFSVVCDEATAAQQLNGYFERLRLWNWQ